LNHKKDKVRERGLALPEWWGTWIGWPGMLQHLVFYVTCRAAEQAEEWSRLGLYNIMNF
jgi:hypothetical protein